VGALIEDIALREISAMQRAADAAPGPVSALAAAIATFAARALRNRRLAWAVVAEPVDPEVETVRLKYRRGLADEVRRRIDAAMAASHVPRQDTALAAPALVGALLEGLIGPLAPQSEQNDARAAVQTLTLLSLRALGVVDARARGLVVQTVLPLADENS
jgi:AcrR family transcriptional regulator